VHDRARSQSPMAMIPTRDAGALGWSAPRALASRAEHLHSGVHEQITSESGAVLAREVGRAELSFQPARGRSARNSYEIDRLNCKSNERL
jgi:hypothetical protein